MQMQYEPRSGIYVPRRDIYVPQSLDEQQALLMPRVFALQRRRAATSTTLSSSLIAIYGSNLKLCLVGDEGASASSWTDQSGTGNTFTQNTAGQRPALTTGGPNSKSYLQFTNANDNVMTKTSFSGITAGDGITGFVVAKRDTGTGSTFAQIFEAAINTADTGEDSGIAFWWDNTGFFGCKTTINSTVKTSNSTDANNTGTWYLGTAYIDAVPNWDFEQNNGTATTTAAGATGLTNTPVTAAVGAACHFFGSYNAINGGIACVVLANVSDATKRASAKAAIQTYYGM